MTDSGPILQARVTAPGDVLVEMGHRPALQPGEMLVAVRAAGICGSDVAIFKGDYPSRLSLPRVLGHEWSGVVVSTHPSVREFHEGDRVTSEEIICCEACEACRSGYFDYCERPAELGFTIDGAHASHVVVPARRCHLLPSSVSFAAGALVEPLSVAFNGLYIASPGLRPGDRVLVLGLGPIGWAAAMWATASGTHVVGVERDSFRARLAIAAGVATVAEEAAAIALDDGLEDFDVLVEATGDHAALNWLLPRLRIHGRIVLLGHAVTSAEIRLEHVTQRGLRVYGSIGQIGRNTYSRVLGLLDAGRIAPESMVTHTFPLMDALAAFRLASARAGVGKVQLRPEYGA